MDGDIGGGRNPQAHACFADFHDVDGDAVVGQNNLLADLT